MTYDKMLSKYKKTNVETASKIDLVIMCYEKAVQCLKQAKMFFEKKDFEKKAKALQKALDIIYELKGALDFEKGGQLAANLDAIYGYLTKSLIEGDISGDIKHFDSAISILDELREAWELIAGEKEDHFSTEAREVSGAFSEGARVAA